MLYLLKLRWINREWSGRPTQERHSTLQFGARDFYAMRQTKGLYKSLIGTEEQPNETASLANETSNEEKKNHKVPKDACEKEVADIREKRNKVWYPLALTLDATIPMLLRHNFVGDDNIRGWAMTQNKLQERFQSWETPIVVTSTTQLARLHLEDFGQLARLQLGQLLHHRTGAAPKAEKAGGAVSESLFSVLFLKDLPMIYENFAIQKSFNLANNFTELRKRLQNFNKSISQKHKEPSGSVASAVKRDFMKITKRENISKYHRREGSKHCSKCGEKSKVDRASKRQRDGGKPESLAVSSTLSTLYQEYWAALT